MRLMIVISAMLLSTSCWAQADEVKPNTACRHEGDTSVILSAPTAMQYLTSGPSKSGGDVLTCIKGKWENTGTIGSTQIAYNIKIMKEDVLLEEAKASAFDGEPVPVSHVEEEAFVAKENLKDNGTKLTPGTVATGFSMSLMSQLVDSNKIVVNFSILRSEIGSISKVEIGGSAYQLPQLADYRLKHSITVEDGKTVAIPFGPLVYQDGDAKPKYTILMMATKVPSRVGL